jgi:hypothetical protein
VTSTSAAQAQAQSSAFAHVSYFFPFRVRSNTKTFFGLPVPPGKACTMRLDSNAVTASLKVRSLLLPGFQDPYKSILIIIIIKLPN